MTILPTQRALALATLFAMVVTASASSPRQTGSLANRAQRIRSLSHELRWHGESDQARYQSVRDSATKDLLNQIDGYIADNFEPTRTTTDEVRRGLDTLLGKKPGEGMHDLAFTTDLPAGRFLIVGVELRRGGDAINEDAISFRAYRQQDDRFIFVDSIDVLGGADDKPSQPLVDLHAVPLSPAPISGEFWLMAWADVPPQSPYTITARAYAFDGKQFRSVWAPADFIVENIDNAVNVNGQNVTLNRMPNWTSQTILHEQYSFSAAGAEKLTDWTSPRQ